MLTLLSLALYPTLQTLLDSQLARGLQEGYGYAAYELREPVEQEDTAALQLWLAQRLGRGLELYPVQAFVINADKRVIARWPEAGASPLGQPFDENAYFMVGQMLPHVWDLESARALLGTRYPQREVTVLVPILNLERRVIGVLIIVGTLVNYLPLMLILSGAGLAMFAVLTLLVGTAFGWLASRGLVRRLNTIAQMTEAWGRGDFSKTIHDTAGDEIGEMARRLDRMAEQLQGTLQTREALAAADERNRLARELHDNVKQAVFATAMQLGAARELIERDPQTAKTHLAEAEHLAQQARDELTGLIRQLRPAALEDRGLAEALRAYVAEWSQRFQISAEIRVQGERAAPLEIEQALFRVAQEALTNVARHSGAGRATLELIYNNDGVALGIGDNGKGFALEAGQRRGIGLDSMRERMEAIGGYLQVVNQAGAGVHIVASVRHRSA